MTMRGFEWLDAHAPLAVAVLLACATLLAIARVIVRQWRTAPAQRSRGWRIVLLVFAQPLCAALLYFALVPPTVRSTAGMLVVATAETTLSEWNAAAGDTRVALPEAPRLPGAERVPDLATALRRYPGTQRVHVVGAGLAVRDRDVARGIALAFEPHALPRGLVELEPPVPAAPGGVIRVGGRVHGLTGGEVELVDPASRRVDRASLSDDGRFVLTATARAPGAALFGLRVRDARRRAVEFAEVPVVVEAPRPPRVLLLAGAPGAELKFLRRWAQDAGLPIHTQIDLGGGLQAGDPPVAFNVDTLARFDLVVLDERAWSSLGDARRAALVAAVRDGLGMLLRVTTALSEAERRRLRALGFDTGGGRDAVPVRLATQAVDDAGARARIGPGTADAPRAHDAEVVEAPALTRRSLRIQASDGLPLLTDGRGDPIAVWRAEGRGRIGVSSLVDSHRLVLAGRPDLHAELWSGAVETLARAQQHGAFAIEGIARPGRRISVCGAMRAARIIAPDGSATPLLVDAANGTRACAAYFPRIDGWHRVQTGDRSQLFHVSANAVPGVQARERRDATLRLAAVAGTQEPAARGAAREHPGARWPWWLAWLVASSALWWFERSRAGRNG